ncbi:glycosyltransferase family 2 protein [Brachybacterium sp. YJGR34]|uniref:glycosyltransferase family 2 protein n=1 Tax=Brachybacterium sp. YJGR34 TaxID=2059911 RepID=UPI000E0AFF4F|nr:glycosyltransferase family 2 protein [Brachybacterium sp. YJGR34]
MTPQVTVIVPVYNSVNYVRESINSAREQTIAPEEVEILAVDDGSTDGSDAVLAELAAQDPRITVLTQENSGTPGGARNPAIDRATGEFLFFLDSDDVLTPDALRSMVTTAQQEGSDVVLGKLASMDGRKAPSSMFTRTVLDADVVRDKIFNTLGPTKLIRRELVERLGVRFPTDQKVGEDQPFIAAVYLSARKISVLADKDYYLIRHRAEGDNMTLSPRSAADYVRTASRCALAIETYTEPGEKRELLLRRPFGWSMKSALSPRWRKLDRPAQERAAQEFRETIGHLYTPTLRALLAEQTRLQLDLLRAGDLDGLDAYIAYAAQNPDRRIVWSGGAFRLGLPPELAAGIPEELREVSAPRMTTRLEDLRIEGGQLQVGASVRIPELDGTPEGLGIRARLRSSELVQDLEVTAEDLTAPATLTARTGDLRKGVWDLFTVVRFGEVETELRLGADRVGTLAPDGVSNLAEDPAAGDRLIAYFTQGPGNLSVDRGGMLKRHLVGAACLGLTLDENGRALMLVQTTRPPAAGDEYFCRLTGAVEHGGRQLLPSLRLGDRLLGLRLPVTAQMIGATVEVSSVLGGVRAPLPAAGSEHWPARAAGFGLVADDAGVLTVTAPSARPAEREVDWFTPTRSLRTRVVGSRTVAAVRSAPLLGPVLERAVRRLRRDRS